MARMRALLLLVVALLLLPRPGGGAVGPVARVAIFNPVLGEALIGAAADDSSTGALDAGAGGSTLAVDIHFGVVGPPDKIANVSQVCFEVSRGYQIGAAPTDPLPHCVLAHPGRHDLAQISGLSPGQHTLLAALRWRDGGGGEATRHPDDGLVRTFFTLAAAPTPDDRGHTEGAAFFLAATRPGGGESSARVFAFAGNELMFRSSGSSNYGSNYPGFWFPTAGICPRSFLQRGGGSFLDVLRASGGSAERLRHALSDPDMMFDKRFSVRYQQREHAAHRDWRITHRPALAARLRDGWIAFNRSLADQSYKDVQSGQFVLHRFSTLRQAVASVRLGLVAWRASGYGALADELLTRGRSAGLDAGELTAPPRVNLVRKDGACAVNTYVGTLGFEIVGWADVKHGCDEGTQQAGGGGGDGGGKESKKEL